MVGDLRIEASEVFTFDQLPDLFETVFRLFLQAGDCGARVAEPGDRLVKRGFERFTREAQIRKFVTAGFRKMSLGALASD